MEVVSDQPVEPFGTAMDEVTRSHNGIKDRRYEEILVHHCHSSAQFVLFVHPWRINPLSVSSFFNIIVFFGLPTRCLRWSCEDVVARNQVDEGGVAGVIGHL